MRIRWNGEEAGGGSPRSLACHSPRSLVTSQAGREGARRDGAAPGLGHQLGAWSESSWLLFLPLPTFHPCSCRAVQPALPWPLPDPAVSLLSSATHQQTTCLIFPAGFFIPSVNSGIPQGVWQMLQAAQGRLKIAGKERGDPWSTGSWTDRAWQSHLMALARGDTLLSIAKG